MCVVKVLLLLPNNIVINIKNEIENLIQLINISVLVSVQVSMVKKFKSTYKRNR